MAPCDPIFTAESISNISTCSFFILSYTPRNLPVHKQLNNGNKANLLRYGTATPVTSCVLVPYAVYLVVIKVV